jgi:hypothetical protein
LIFLKQGDSFSVFYHYYWWRIEFRVNKPAPPPPATPPQEPIEFDDSVEAIVLDTPPAQPETMTIVDDGEDLEFNSSIMMWLNTLPKEERDRERKVLEKQLKPSS